MAEQEPPQAYIRPRPIRVAFLVADGDYSHLILDGIFAESFTRWGGRYSLICPCEDGFPRASYLPWLTALDPDIIYSFIDLTDDNLLRIRERFGPAYFVRHRDNFKGKPTAYDFRVNLPIQPLVSLSTTLQYAQAFPASAPKPVRVVDYLPGQPPDRFVDDNFGTFYGSYGQWPIPSNLADVVKPLAIASEELLSAPNIGRHYEGETVPDAVALLTFMAANSNTYGLAQIAADATPRIELLDNYHNAFTLIIGDSFADRVAFWNLRSRDPVFFGRAMTTLIVSPARLEHPAFFAALSEFLGKRNGTPRSGLPRVQLTSTSLTTEYLTELKERFRVINQWNNYHVVPSITLDSITPSAQVIKQARVLVSGGFFERGPEWKEFPATGDKTRPSAVAPKHLPYGPSGSLATKGSWALDVTIERQENHSRYSNVRHSWFIPRRLRFEQAFLSFYESIHSGREYRHVRSNSQGSLSLYAGLGEELPFITLPTDETAFRYAMHRGDTWPPFRSIDSWERPRGPFAWAQSSDKGRYLIGALRLFDGLQNAAAVLLHHYWRSTFEELGGAIGTARREQIKNSIKKKVRAVKTKPDEWNDETWERITSLVASEAHQVRIPQQSLSYEELIKRHTPFIEKEKERLRDQKAEDAEDWIAHANRSLRSSVQDRCARKILFQGYEWRCDTCFNANWNDLSALKHELTCAICGAAEPAPVDKPWSFRLNGFLQDAMREHGLLALVWCLVVLESRVRTTFFYLGPHDLWKDFPEDENTPSDHEADLICVVDGQVHLCEVKSSGRDIDLTSVVEVAKRLRPNKVTLAVMELPSPRLTAKLEELKLALADSEIEAELLTFRDDSDFHDAYLP